MSYSNPRHSATSRHSSQQKPTCGILVASHQHQLPFQFQFHNSITIDAGISDGSRANLHVGVVTTAICNEYRNESRSRVRGRGTGYVEVGRCRVGEEGRGKPARGRVEVDDVTGPHLPHARLLQTRLLERAVGDLSDSCAHEGRAMEVEMGDYDGRQADGSAARRSPATRQHRRLFLLLKSLFRMSSSYRIAFEQG